MEGEALSSPNTENQDTNNVGVESDSFEKSKSFEEDRSSEGDYIETGLISETVENDDEDLVGHGGGNYDMDDESDQQEEEEDTAYHEEATEHVDDGEGEEDEKYDHQDNSDHNECDLELENELDDQENNDADNESAFQDNDGDDSNHHEVEDGEADLLEDEDADGDQIQGDHQYEVDDEKTNLHEDEDINHHEDENINPHEDEDRNHHEDENINPHEDEDINHHEDEDVNPHDDDDINTHEDEDVNPHEDDVANSHEEDETSVPEHADYNDDNDIEPNESPSDPFQEDDRIGSRSPDDKENGNKVVDNDLSEDFEDNVDKKQEQNDASNASEDEITEIDQYRELDNQSKEIDDQSEKHSDGNVMGTDENTDKTDVNNENKDDLPEEDDNEGEKEEDAKSTGSNEGDFEEFEEIEEYINDEDDEENEAPLRSPEGDLDKTKTSYSPMHSHSPRPMDLGVARPRTPSGPGPETPIDDRPRTPSEDRPQTPTETRPPTTSSEGNNQSFDSSASDTEKVPSFEMITQNEYISAYKQRSSKDKKLVCSCEFNAEDPSTHCTDTCLNKVLMIECNSRCPCGDLCKNKKFQRADYAKTQPFYTGIKGWGLRASQDIIPGDFVMEYCGEVVNQKHFEKRMDEYSKRRYRHYYFMTISKDEIIDAQNKGNLSRFINHSCDPNCETQKWRVNGVLRIGFFALKHIKKGEELCFDYQYQRYGDDVQKCYCGTEKCRGTLGEKAPEIKSNTPLRGEKAEKLTDKQSSFEQSIAKITKDDKSLLSPDHALQLSRLMVQTDLIEHRIAILNVLQATTDATSLKRFLIYQGLNILWSWMVDVSVYTTALRSECKLLLIKVLMSLPITTKNSVEDSKVIKVLKKWVDNEHSSNSSQADSSEEGPPLSAEELDNPPVDTTETDKQVLEEGIKLLNQWNNLKEVFKIPKKEKKANSPPKPRHMPAFSLSAFLAGSDSSPEQKRKEYNKYDSPYDNKHDNRRDMGRYDRRKSPERRGGPYGMPPYMHQPDNFSKRPELTEKDYALPTSFGSTKRDYNRPSYNENENMWDSRKRRNDRDDYNCRYDKRSRNDNRNDGRDRKSFRWDRNSDRNSDRYNKMDDRRCRDDKPHDRERSGERRRSRDDRIRGGKEEAGKSSDMRVSRFDKDDMDTGNMNEKRSRFDNVRSEPPAKQDIPTSKTVDPSPQSELPSNPPIPAFPPRLPFAPGNNFNPRNMSSQSQYPGHIQQMYNSNRMPRPPRMDQNNRFPLNNRFPGDSNIPRPRFDALRLPNNNRPPRYDNQWNNQMKSRFAPPADTNDMTSNRPQMPPRFPPPNLPQMPHDLFKQSLPANLMVPPPTAMPLAFNPHFTGTPNMPGVFNVPNPSNSNIPVSMPTSSLSSVSQQSSVSKPMPPISLSEKVFNTVNKQAPSIDLGDKSFKTVRDPEPELKKPIVKQEAKPEPKQEQEAKLPPHWRTAKDSDGKVYYYHALTRETQWDPPMVEERSVTKIETPASPKVQQPTTPQPRRKREVQSTETKKEKVKKAEPSAEMDPDSKRALAEFKNQMAKVVVNILGKYNKVDCKVGRIMDNADFKYLARKLTHGLTEKEMSRKAVTDLAITDNLKQRVKLYITNYMSKFGPIYHKI